MLFAAALEINYEVVRPLFRVCNLGKPLLLMNRRRSKKSNSKGVP